MTQKEFRFTVDAKLDEITQKHIENFEKGDHIKYYLFEHFYGDNPGFRFMSNKPLLYHIQCDIEALNRAFSPFLCK